MKPRRMTSVARVTGGRLKGDDVEVRGVATDSREVRPGDLFVAVPGERVDGHLHVGDAFVAGAGGGLVSRPARLDGPVVVVDDTRGALLRLAGDERDTIEADVVGITGSTGKTSAKDLTAAVLATRFRTAASPRSFNTEVGVPLTLLNAPPDAEAVVCEMGSRGPGHIAALCEVARPQVGVVTNVGLAHMEMFRTAEAVADAKAELVEALAGDGVAVLNADDPVVAAFTLRTPGGTERVELAVPGEHMAWNALAAAAAGTALGLSTGECAAGLKEARVSAWRMEVFDTAAGVTVVN